MSKPPSKPASKRGSKKNGDNTRAKETVLHGKVTEPLVSPKNANSNGKGNGYKESPNAKTGAENKPSRGQLFRRKPQEDKVYTSFKNRHKPVFSKVTAGASSRGSAQTDSIRFKIVWGISLVLLVMLLSRAVMLQVVDAQLYIDKGNELITSTRTIKSYRGMITDRNHLPLAVSAPLSTVYFSPYDYAQTYYEVKKRQLDNADSPKVQESLAKRLEELDLTRLATTSGMSLERLQQAVALKKDVNLSDPEAIKQALPKGNGSHYLPLLNDVTPEIAAAVMALDFAGVYEDQEFRRYYPQPQPNAQLLGFMGYNVGKSKSDYEGRAGIERQYEKQLAGKDGKILVLRDAQRNSLKELQQIEPGVPGQDITLSIDSRLQYLLYKELEKVGRLQQARWSTGMVIDVHTGEVLALSTWPSFNNNDLNKMTGNNQRNRAVLDAFEPGSVMKPFTVAAALDSGKYTERSLIDTNPGSIRVRGYTIRDHGNLGVINMATLIQKSSNVAATKIALSLPADGISSVQKRFGFGSKTPLQFPGEQAGMLTTPKEIETSRRATLSYGYGLQVTLAQLAQAYATLGAGGVMHPLTLLKVDKDTSPPERRIIDADKAMAVVKMMESVTQTGGTATAAAIDGYRVAGKTGTSRRVNPEGGYYEDQYRTVFAGIAPASNPRLAAVILVEDPQKEHYAGQVAAPVFRNVMQEALRLYNVPLDKPLQQ